MTLFRKFIHLRRLFRLLPKLDKSLNELEALVPKLEKINLDKRIAEMGIINEFIPRFEQLDSALVKLADVGKPIEVRVMESPKKKPVLDLTEQHELNRLRMLSKFVALSGRAREIELEWQRIQQDDNDETFAFKMLRGQNENMYFYKKGIVEGIKWCVNRFT